MDVAPNAHLNVLAKVHVPTIPAMAVRVVMTPAPKTRVSQVQMVNRVAALPAIQTANFSI